MPPARSQFGDTRWSIVLAAQAGDEGVAQAALEELCGAYWAPLYAFVRRNGHPPTEAEDLTQEFFARLLEKNWLADVERRKGRFRAFLLAALKHFLANEWRRANTQKRGGTTIVLPLDAEERYAAEPADTLSPERLYDRRWAVAVLEQVFDALRAELEQAGKGALFATLKDLLALDPQRLSYAAAALQLGLSEDAVKMTVYRLRKRYRDLLRAHIAATVGTSAEIDEEIRELSAALRTG